MHPCPLPHLAGANAYGALIKPPNVGPLFLTPSPMLTLMFTAKTGISVLQIRSLSLLPFFEVTINIKESLICATTFYWRVLKKCVSSLYISTFSAAIKTLYINIGNLL